MGFEGHESRVWQSGGETEGREPSLVPALRGFPSSFREATHTGRGIQHLITDPNWSAYQKIDHMRVSTWMTVAYTWNSQSSDHHHLPFPSLPALRLARIIYSCSFWNSCLCLKVVLFSVTNQTM